MQGGLPAVIANTFSVLNVLEFGSVLSYGYMDACFFISTYGGGPL